MATKKNEHADYIEKTHKGGLSSYTQNQQERYDGALATGNTDLISRLQADASRVGYSLAATAPKVSTPSYTPKKVSYMSGGDMASNLGLDYNYQNILNKLRDATQAEYVAKNKEFAQTENKYYDAMYGTQGTALDTIRKSQAQAIATGASRGLQMSNELSSILGLQQESVMGATQLAQDRNLLKDKETAAQTQNVVDATTTYNNLGTTLGGLINNKYAADVEQNIGTMGYYSQLDQNAKNLEGTIYGANQNLAGNVHTANQNLAGTQFAAERGKEATLGAANISAQAQRDAATISAEATKYAAHQSASVQKAYYDSLNAQSPDQVFKLLNDAKTEPEFVAVLVRQGVSEELAQQYWKNKSIKTAQEALTELITGRFYQQSVSSTPAPATDPALGGSGTPSGYQPNQFGNWLYEHNFIDAKK